MPQLAPLSWALAPLIFWILLLSLSSSIWWDPKLEFPLFKSTSNYPFSKWAWK